MAFIEKMLRVVCDPGWVLEAAWRRIPLGSIELRSKFDAVHRPQYVYGILNAAILCRALGLGRMAAVEFGVASGDGFLEMENIAIEVSRRFNVKIEVYGFDIAQGLPMPRDYRDMPYHWTYQSKIHDFRMDPARLAARLKFAKWSWGT